MSIRARHRWPAGKGAIEFGLAGCTLLALALVASRSVEAQDQQDETSSEAQSEPGTLSRLLGAGGETARIAVLDSEERPLPDGSTFEARLIDLEARFMYKVMETVQAGGFLVISGLKANRYILCLVHAEYETVELEFEPSEENLRIVLTPHGWVEGRLVDPSGEPKAGIDVTVAFSGQPASESAVQRSREVTGRTDNAGFFRAAGPDSGQYTVRLSAEGFAPHTFESIELRPASASSLGDLQLLAAGVVELIMRRGATPLAGEKVSVYGTRQGEEAPSRYLRAGRDWSPLLTDEHGRLVLEDLRPGRWTFTVRLLATRESCRTPVVPVRAGETARWEFSLGTGVITGRVVDDSGDPVAMVTVGTIAEEARDSLARGLLWFDQRTACDAEGRFAIRGLEPGTYAVGAEKEGYRNVIREGVLVPEEGEQAPIVLTLEYVGLATVQIRLLRSDGTVVSESRARLEYEYLAGEEREQPRKRSTFRQTDQDGYVSLQRLRPGRVRMTATIEETAPTCIEVDLADGQNGPFELRLSEGATVRGKVIDRDGLPIAGARVRLVPYDEAIEEELARREEQEDWEELKREVPEALEEAVERTRQLELLAEQLEEMEDRLGTQKDPLRFSTPASAKTKEDGWFELRFVGKGEYVATTSKRGYRRARSDRLVIEGEVAVTCADIVLEERTKQSTERGTLKLRVIDGATGRPLPGREVEIQTEICCPDMIYSIGKYAESGKGGIAIVRELPCGAATVSIISGDLACEPVPVEIVEGDTSPVVDIFLSQAGSISGIVQDPLGSPVADACLALLQLEDDRCTGTGGERTDAEGRFEYRGLLSGEYRIQARGKGFAPGESRTVTISLGQEVRNVIVGLLPAARISGRVVDENGLPVPGASLSIEPDYGQVLKQGGFWGPLMLHTEGGTDSSGRYSVGDLPAGHFRIQATLGNRRGSTTFSLNEGEHLELPDLVIQEQ